MLNWLKDIFAVKKAVEAAGETIELETADQAVPAEVLTEPAEELTPEPYSPHSREIEHIIIHCSATRENNDIGAHELRLIHTAPKPNGNGWRDIGYNYVIRRDGTIEIGRDLNDNGLTDDDVGAHAYGWNSNSIGICLIGGADVRGRGEANFTPAQMTALAAFLVAKQQQYPDAKIMGHRDTGANKDCPSFDVGHWLRTGKLINPLNLA